MRDLLFLSHRIPYPPDKGDKIRAWNILRYLAQTHRIHLGCFVDSKADQQHVSLLAQYCTDLACLPLDPWAQRLKTLLWARPGLPLSMLYFRDRRLQRWVDAKLTSGRIDSVYAFSSAIAGYAMQAVGVKRILDMVDVDSEKWNAYAPTARFPARYVWAREGRRLLAFERLAAASFDHSLFVSENEWRHFVTLAPEAVHRTGWMVSISTTSRPDTTSFPHSPATVRIWCSLAGWTISRTSTRCSGLPMKCCRCCGGVFPSRASGSWVRSRPGRCARLPN
jgi:hypothetical protein